MVLVVFSLASDVTRTLDRLCGYVCVWYASYDDDNVSVWSSGLL
jgi:hypothetical protein